jgi:uncharacterized membrane protein YphA (DoxX/SURF4 family)
MILAPKILLALRLILAAVFLYAAYNKLKESYLVFALSIDAYQMLPPAVVLWAAWILPKAELVLGILLLGGWWLRPVAAASTALLGFFFAILVWSYAKGSPIDCGCFGSGDALSPKTLFRDGSLVAVSGAVAWLAFRVRR